MPYSGIPSSKHSSLQTLWQRPRRRRFLLQRCIILKKLHAPSNIVRSYIESIPPRRSMESQDIQRNGNRYTPRKWPNLRNIGGSP
jgi:hypothetical protein